jgi:hypothetical protein
MGTTALLLQQALLPLALLVPVAAVSSNLPPAPVPVLAEQLVMLAGLHQNGDLTAAEFTQAKRAALLLAAPTDAATAPPPTAKPPHRTGPGFSVRDFGARGDGKTDDTAAFTAAFAAAVLGYHEMDCGKGCGRTVPDVFVPSGHYLLSSSIDIGGKVPGAGMKYIPGVFPGVHGEGTAILQQTNASADIFYTEHVWRTQISGLHFVGGRNHLHLGTNNIDSSFILVERCVFANASSAAIRMIQATGLYPSPHWNGSKDSYHGSASTQVTVRNSEFFHNEQVVVNWCDLAVSFVMQSRCASAGPELIHPTATPANLYSTFRCDGFAFLDNWVGGCYEPTCGRGKALLAMGGRIIQTMPSIFCVDNQLMKYAKRHPNDFTAPTGQALFENHDTLFIERMLSRLARGV